MADGSTLERSSSLLCPPSDPVQTSLQMIWCLLEPRLGAQQQVLLEDLRPARPRHHDLWRHFSTSCFQPIRAALHPRWPSSVLQHALPVRSANRAGLNLESMVCFCICSSYSFNKGCGRLVTKPLFELMDAGYGNSNSPPQGVNMGKCWLLLLPSSGNVERTNEGKSTSR